MIVQYIKETSGWLRTGSNYAVQEIFFEKQRGVSYRIISDDAATPAFFPANECTIIDGSIPSSWKAHIYDTGSFVLSPPAWLEPGFWERYFDDDPEAKRIFEQNISSIP